LRLDLKFAPADSFRFLALELWRLPCRNRRQTQRKGFFAVRHDHRHREYCSPDWRCNQDRNRRLQMRRRIHSFAEGRRSSPPSRNFPLPQISHQPRVSCLEFNRRVSDKRRMQLSPDRAGTLSHSSISNSMSFSRSVCRNQTADRSETSYVCPYGYESHEFNAIPSPRTRPVGNTYARWNTRLPATGQPQHPCSSRGAIECKRGPHGRASFSRKKFFRLLTAPALDASHPFPANCSTIFTTFWLQGQDSRKNAAVNCCTPFQVPRF